MEATGVLAALAQEDRLAVFRLLVRVGSGGLAAGEIARTLEIRPPTLTFHLNQLVAAGLLTRRRAGRRRVYALDAGATRALLSFLGEDCCQGRKDLCTTAGPGARARFEGLRAGQSRPTVLFLCSGGSARSVMAEALLRWNAGRRFDVYSAGIRPTAVHPLARRVLEEIGIAASELRSTDLGSLLGRVGIDHAIVVCGGAEEACKDILPFARQRTYWPVDDPVLEGADEGALLTAFRNARDELDERIRGWLRDGMLADRA